MTSPNISTALLEQHLASGDLVAGREIGLYATQALLTDVLGTLVVLELEAMGADRIRIGLAAQYVDHNLLEVDHLNAEEHAFLRSACRKLGTWYARPGTGISHPTHMQHFGRPGGLLVGCDSHTCAAGSLGMLAIGMGGIDVALAMMCEPVFITMPEIWGVRLSGALPPWTSAKDVILEMLRRHGVEGGFGRIIEYYGPGLACLSAMDRHVIANMGAEMGATTTMFPSDGQTRLYLETTGRGGEFTPSPDIDRVRFDHHDEIDLSGLEPLIATPGSPGNVVRVRDLPPTEVYQSYIGSSANPGYRDLATVAQIVSGRTIHDRVSLDLNPSTRTLLRQLSSEGHLASLLDAGGRVHQPGCNGCIGMGQAPAKGRASLRTVPRNFPGRSGTIEDSVYLCSPETAAASALTGVITDPRDLDMPVPLILEPRSSEAPRADLIPPICPEEATDSVIERTSNIGILPQLAPLAPSAIAPILLKVGDDISTDAILPAGNEVMPHWTNFDRVARYVFRDVDPDYSVRASKRWNEGAAHVIVGGTNYGQGSSRENAALIPKILGLSIVLAKSIARLHWQNLVNFGVLPLLFETESDYEDLYPSVELRVEEVFAKLRSGRRVPLVVEHRTIWATHSLSTRQIAIIEAGGAINAYAARRGGTPSPTGDVQIRSDKEGRRAEDARTSG